MLSEKLVSITLVEVVKLGLRPLVVHFNYGWNSDTSISNMNDVFRN